MELGGLYHLSKRSCADWAQALQLTAISQGGLLFLTKNCGSDVKV